MAILGALGRGAYGGIKAGGKAAAGAAALGTGAFLRQAASPIPGGAAAMTAGLGLVGAVGSGAVSAFKGTGAKGGAGGAGGGGAGGGAEVLVQGIQKLLEVNQKGFSDVAIIKGLLQDMRDKAYESARDSLKPTGDMGDGLKLAAANDNDASFEPSQGAKKPSMLKILGIAAIATYIADLIKALKLKIGNAFTSLKTFFGKTGPIGKGLASLKLWFQESKVFQGVKNLFGKEGAIAQKFTSIKDAIKNAKGNVAAKITEIFGKNGSMATRLATFKTAVSTTASNALAGIKNINVTGALQGGMEKVKAFGGKAKAGAIETFTKGMAKIKSMLQGVKDIGAKVIDFVTKNPLMNKIGSIAKGFGQLLGRIFAPILAIWSIFEGGKEGVKAVGEEGETADSDILTKIYAGIGGFMGGIVGFLIGGIMDLGVSVGAWIAGKLGFTETKEMMEGFLKERGGFTGLIKSFFSTIANIPIAIWKWMKGLLGIGDAESEEGKAGAGFIDKFKSVLGGMWDKISGMIPNFGDIKNIAANVFDKVVMWFGDQLISIGKFFKDDIGYAFGRNVGSWFIQKGEAMKSGAQGRMDERSAVQSDTTNVAGQIAGAEGGASNAGGGGDSAGGTMMQGGGGGETGSKEPPGMTLEQVDPLSDSLSQNDLDAFAFGKN